MCYYMSEGLWSLKVLLSKKSLGSSFSYLGSQFTSYVKVLFPSNYMQIENNCHSLSAYYLFTPCLLMFITQWDWILSDENAGEWK